MAESGEPLPSEDEEAKQKSNSTRIRFLVRLFIGLSWSALLALSLLLYFDVIPPQSSSSSSSSSTVSSDSSPSGGASGPGPELRTEDLEFRSFGDDASVPDGNGGGGAGTTGAAGSSGSTGPIDFAPGPFLEQQFPLTKVEAGKTYLMLCKCVMRSKLLQIAEKNAAESFGLSAVKFVPKEGEGATEGDVQMVTVVAGCVDPATGPTSFVRMNHDVTELSPSTAWQTNVEKWASDGIPAQGLPLTLPADGSWTSYVIHPRFCLLEPGQALRTVTLKNDNFDPAPGAGTFYVKVRPPQPFPVLFAVPPLDHQAQAQTSVSSLQYLQSKPSAPKSSWYLPVGMTCIPANSLPGLGGYLALYFMRDKGNTLLGATVLISLDGEKTQGYISVKGNGLVYDFKDVIVPDDDLATDPPVV